MTCSGPLILTQSLEISFELTRPSRNRLSSLEIHAESHYPRERRTSEKKNMNSIIDIVIATSLPARVAKLADARDLKSRVLNRTYRFNSGPGHHEL